MMKIIVLLSMVLSLLVSAQEEVPPKYMRFIPLGEIPVWKEEIVDSTRVQKEYEPGEMPPKDIMIGVREGSMESSKLFLREFTGLFTFSGALERLKIGQGAEGSASAWLDSAMAKPRYSLGVLYRDHEDMTWLKPRLKIFRDDLTVFPLGTMRFANVSLNDVLIKVNDQEPFLVKPGDAIVYPIAVGGVRVQATAVTQEGLHRRIYDNNLELRENERVQGFFFKSQSPAPANPVQIFYYPEKFVSPKKPKEDEADKEDDSQP
ncbi:hypothetical protein N9A94_08740 [Akkermansiaceae bacterium]|jgi:hypothetical protein|nr:hypothetical protein [Akkermansiaceae bacterium]MDA7888124.1 hypothetical protein [Akkermansiaceae bacterium]MDB4537050.1 hypothetical protein [Akkermansiaceae bacterium]MDB4544558.1 hypothetical protein [Akkermansiaceae bacterium]